MCRAGMSRRFCRGAQGGRMTDVLVLPSQPLARFATFIFSFCNPEIFAESLAQA